MNLLALAPRGVSHDGSNFVGEDIMAGVVFGSTPRTICYMMPQAARRYARNAVVLRLRCLLAWLAVQ